MKLFVLSDSVNSGKSTFCLSLAREFLLENKKVCGWISPPKILNSKKIGQEIIYFSNNKESFPKNFFTYKNGFQKNAFHCPNFDNCDIFFMDEIGPMELDKNGFHLEIIKNIQKGKTVIAVVRNGLTDDIISFYDWKPKTILSLGEAKKNIKAMIDDY